MQFLPQSTTSSYLARPGPPNKHDGFDTKVSKTIVLILLVKNFYHHVFDAPVPGFRFTVQAWNKEEPLLFASGKGFFQKTCAFSPTFPGTSFCLVSLRIFVYNKRNYNRSGGSTNPVRKNVFPVHPLSVRSRAIPEEAKKPSAPHKTDTSEKSRR